MGTLRNETPDDLEVLERIAPVVENLWKPLRFLADLKQVWPVLTEDEREEIKRSRPFRERFHERLAERYVVELMDMTQEIHSTKYRGLREELSEFLERWDEQEPDRLKIMNAVIRADLEKG